MIRVIGILWVLSIAAVTTAGGAQAQGFGGFDAFGGAGNASGHTSYSGNAWVPAAELPLLPPDKALNYITVDGTAEIRVAPEEIRVVLAVTSEAETAIACQEMNAAQVRAVKQAWTRQRIAAENVVEDFINVLPRYEWRLVERDGQEVRIQQQQGYRMQTNLHVLVRNEEEAMQAVNAAFEHGVTDIVTFDYWSSKLNEQKAEARQAALSAAKEKSKVLLSLFAEQPIPINVQESTAVFFPHSLYRTYENILEEEVEYDSRWRDRPAIKAFRPKMTFFHGLQSRADVRPSEPAMRPEIAIISTVRIYYESPAEKTPSGEGE